jgi:phosphate:Na+ symporter
MVRTGVARAFGANLRSLINRSTGNRLASLAAGLGATMVLQSSTATALITTSFVRRGLMTTAAALAVMLGADVGTALVAQLLSLSVAWFSPILILAGYATFVTGKASYRRDVGRIGIGVGLMLLALHLMVAGSEPLRQSVALRSILGATMGEPVLAILIAALLTWLAHSSLAMVIFVMSLAGAGVVTPGTALVLVLGVNLGAGLPALMDTLADGPEARRVTLANIAFRLIGVLVAWPLLGLLAPEISALASDPAQQVLNFHLAFNLALALLFIGATGPAAALAERLLPKRVAPDEPGRPRYLDRSTMETPSVALTCAARETLHMGDFIETMLRNSITALRTNDRRLVADVERMDNAVDRLHEAIKLYVTEITREALDEAQGRRATEIITFTTNLEHIGDIIDKNLMELAQKKIKNQSRFSADGEAELVRFHARVAENLKLALGAFMSGDVKIARQLLDEKVRVRDAERAAAESHFARLREGRADSIASSALHLDVLRDLKRIHSHICAVAYPILESAGQLRPTRLVDEFEAPTGAATPAQLGPVAGPRGG